jgi:hypothetical protein
MESRIELLDFFEIFFELPIDIVYVFLAHLKDPKHFNKKSMNYFLNAH